MGRVVLDQDCEVLKVKPFLWQSRILCRILEMDLDKQELVCDILPDLHLLWATVDRLPTRT